MLAFYFAMFTCLACTLIKGKRIGLENKPNSCRVAVDSCTTLYDF